MQEIDEYGVITTYTYDKYGDLNCKIVSHNNNTETFTYYADTQLTNGDRQLVKKEATPISNKTSDYDSLTGNLNRLRFNVDENEFYHELSYKYDEANRVKSASFISQNGLDYECGRITQCTTAFKSVHKWRSVGNVRDDNST